MSDRPQTQPSRAQGTESSMSASGDGKQFLDPRRPGYAGQPSRGASGSQRQLDYNTRDLLEDTELAPTDPLQKLKNKITPGGRQEHTLGSGTQAMPADMLGDNDLVRQGLPNTSPVSQGKQKVPQKGQGSTAKSSAGTLDSVVPAEARQKVRQGKQKVPQDVGGSTPRPSVPKGGASTAKPSAGTSDSLVPAEKTPEEKLKDLLTRAMAVPRNKDRIAWPREHDDFLKGYIDLYEKSDRTISWQAMGDTYKAFLQYYPLEQLYRKRQSMKEK